MNQLKISDSLKIVAKKKFLKKGLLPVYKRNSLPLVIATEMTNKEGAKDDLNQGMHFREGSGGARKLIIQKPFNILLDLYGVTTPWPFANKTLPEFFYSHVKEYVIDSLSLPDAVESENKVTSEMNTAKRVRSVDVVGGLHAIAPNSSQNSMESNKSLRPVTDKKVCERVIEKIRKENELELASGEWKDLPKLEEYTKGGDHTLLAESVHKIAVWYRENKKPSEGISLMQTHVWTWGYRTKKLLVQIYEDVPRVLGNWRGEKLIKIYILSSGSKESLKEFFTCTDKGDLTKWIANYIEASSSKKRDVNSYKTWLIMLRERVPSFMLWISDHPKEARAGREAGIKSILLMRPDGPQYSAEDIGDLLVVKSLDEIEFLDNPNADEPCC